MICFNTFLFSINVRSGLHHSTTPITTMKCVLLIARRYYSRKKDQPIPFLNSPARHRKLKHVLEVDETRTQRYAVPLGLGLFALLIYFGFREHDRKDQDTSINDRSDASDDLQTQSPVNNESIN